MAAIRPRSRFDTRRMVAGLASSRSAVALTADDERPERSAWQSSAPGLRPSTRPAPLLASEDPVVEVDMIERLPTPWGLVRLGVAPDHPQLKTVSRAFEKIAARPGFRFLGNVEVGRDVTHEELTSAYDAVVYAVGSQTDRKLGIPGEELPGSWAATELVAWYNGHPDFQHLEFDLSHERAVVIGNGNVALDVARMLALTEAELAPTDTTDAAIAAIVSSGIREIVVLGRRGPVQAAWTSTELGELGELAGADVVVDPAELELDAASEAELEAASNVVQRNVEILREFATHHPSGKPRVVRLRFRVSPVADPGRGARRGRRDRPQPPRARRARFGACGRDRRARGHSVRDRLSQRRVPRCGDSRSPVRRGRGEDPERRGPRARRGRKPDPGPLLRRVDQARPDRRHRHQQEGRDGDGREPARGRPVRPTSRAPRESASKSCSSSAAQTSWRMPGGRQSTSPSVRRAMSRGARASSSAAGTSSSRLRAQARSASSVRSTSASVL